MKYQIGVMDHSGPLSLADIEAASFPFIIDELGDALIRIVAGPGMPQPRAVRKQLQDASRQKAMGDVFVFTVCTPGRDFLGFAKPHGCHRSIQPPKTRKARPQQDLVTEDTL